MPAALVVLDVLRRSDLLELALHGVIGGAAVGAGPGAGAGAGRLALGLAGGSTTGAVGSVGAGHARTIHRAGSLVGGRRDAGQRAGQCIHAGLDGGDVGALEGLAERGDLPLDLGAILGRHLVTEIPDGPLGLVGQLLRLVAGLDLL